MPVLVASVQGARSPIEVHCCVLELALGLERLARMPNAWAVARDGSLRGSWLRGCKNLWRKSMWWDSRVRQRAEACAWWTLGDAMEIDTDIGRIREECIVCVILLSHFLERIMSLLYWAMFRVTSNRNLSRCSNSLLGLCHKDTTKMVHWESKRWRERNQNPKGRKRKRKRRTVAMISRSFTEPGKMFSRLMLIVLPNVMIKVSFQSTCNINASLTSWTTIRRWQLRLIQWRGWSQKIFWCQSTVPGAWCLMPDAWCLKYRSAMSGVSLSYAWGVTQLFLLLMIDRFNDQAYVRFESSIGFEDRRRTTDLQFSNYTRMIEQITSAARWKNRASLGSSSLFSLFWWRIFSPLRDTRSRS